MGLTMASNRKQHWNEVYAKKSPNELTWFQPRPETSIALIRRAGLGPESRFIDVGGGTSLLTASLLEEGFQHLSVLDVSGRALELAKARLGERASEIEWYEADLTSFDPPHPWDFWHDRAVFHFLTTEEDRAAYCGAMNNSVESGGHVMIATFALDGPTRCSGLEVVRYNPESLLATLGEEYQLRGSIDEVHRTPTGGTQSFVYSWFQRTTLPGGPHQE
jgi:2-polyprenyl-3-methyl-5-hydroxy-6-metoxy-1,4-benzoquinol methylase